MHDFAQSPKRRGYPSDLTDAQWRTVAPLMPPDPKRGRRRRTDMREVVNAINYRWTTGCVWRMLPHDFPPWETVYTYFRRWQRDGTLIRIREVLLRRRPQGISYRANASPVAVDCSRPNDSPEPLRDENCSVSRPMDEANCSDATPWPSKEPVIRA